MLAHQRHHPGEPRARAVAVLVVDRVDHRAAAEQLQAGLDHLRLGGVEHQRQRGRGGQPADDLAHVAGAVPADVVDVHVQQVRAVPGLRPGNLDAVVVAPGDHRVAECPGPVRVGPLADRQERGVLPERHVLVERGDAGLGPRPARGQRPVPQPGDDGGQVLGRGPAAAARQREPELGGEHLMGVGELVGGHRVVRAIGGELGQPGIRHAGQRHARVRGQVAQVLAHLAGTRRAVEPDHVDAERLERGERRADLGAEQHRAGRLDSDLGDQQDIGAGGRDRPAGADDRRFGLQQVLAGLDDQRVGAAAQQAGGVALVGVAELRERDVAERRQLRAGPHRAEHPARPAGAGGLVGRLPGQPRAALGEFLDPAGDPVLAEIAEVRAERVSADAVDPGVQVAVMDSPDDVRAGDVQDLVAAFVPGKVVDRDRAALQHGSHRAVGDDYPLAERRAQGCRAAGSAGRSTLSWAAGHPPRTGLLTH